MPDTVQADDRTTAHPGVVVALALGSVAVLSAAVVLLWSGVVTVSGRIAASTSNESSLLAAVAVDLVVEGGADVASTGLLIDASGLYPGLRVERCFEVTYSGTVGDVPVRLYGKSGGGTGLERFIDTTVSLGEGSDHLCADFAARRTLFQGTLLDLWNAHRNFDDGLRLMDRAGDGEGTWVRVEVEVVDDNRAQGLTTAFWLTLEARP